MNPLLGKLHPYPFERLRALTSGITPNPAYKAISLGIGEPRHATPALVEEAMVPGCPGLSVYPPTAGEPRLREAFTGWLQRRYGVALDAATQVLPVNGSARGAVRLAQTVIDPTRPGATVVCPNPFYQIYEGAALLAGASRVANSDPARNFAADWDSIDEATWARTQLLYVCSPGNPTGAVMPLDEWRAVRAERPPRLRDRQRRVLQRDLLPRRAAAGRAGGGGQAGAHDFRNLIAFTSLSKRSNVPGCARASWPATRRILKQFLLYRTYHGSAMSPVVQAASVAAWNDEAHVVANRALYRAKFAQVTPVLADVLDVPCPTPASTSGPACRPPSGGQPGDDILRLDLLAQYNVAVLPGSLLARDRPRATTRAPAASAWPWWQAPTNAWKPPTASSPSPANPA
jgi:N-succinyldiaminopimelate aminotransferase